MVRLKGDGCEHRDARLDWFQFHNGSIKRQVERVCVKAESEFQFHNGSIKSQ